MKAVRSGVFSHAHIRKVAHISTMVTIASSLALNPYKPLFIIFLYPHYKTATKSSKCNDLKLRNFIASGHRLIDPFRIGNYIYSSPSLNCNILRVLKKEIDELV